MRRRIVVAIAAVAAASIVLFAIPLAFVVRQSYRDAELLRLQRDAFAATRQIDLAPARGDSIELPRSADEIAVYSRDGTRRAGSGPARADGLVSRALASERPANAAQGGRLVAAVPLIARERLTGVVRVSRGAGSVTGRIRRAWLTVALLAGMALAAALAAAVIVGRRMAKPLERLAGSARRLGDGDFTIEAPRAGIGEIDAVAASLNATAGRLGDMVSRERAFSANASHQLRTPLAALRLEIESMQLGSRPPPETARALEQVERLQGTVETLLGVARGAPPTRGDLDLLAIAMELEMRWRAPLAAAGRPLRIEVAQPAPAAKGSADVVREILAVLVENALVHGSGVVSVVVRQASPGWVAFEVSDEGKGIAPAEGDVFAGGHGDGHGIGLPLARSLAEAEGGQLTLGRGTPMPAFVLYLPQAHGAAAEAGAPSAVDGRPMVRRGPG